MQVTDAHEIARIEAENTLRQFDLAMDELAKWISEPRYRLRVSMILRLNRAALEGLSHYAGTFRPGGITIRGSRHSPISAELVAAEMEDFCDYIEREWSRQTPIHLAAYALWRLNWIHPFVDGNGRTARAVSYVILCAKLGYRIPGRDTLPEQIAANKSPYYAALEAADRSLARSEGKPDVSELEALIEGLLANQLLRVHEAATGKGPSRRAAVLPPEDGKGLRQPPRRSEGLFSHIEQHPVLYGGAATILAAILAILFT